MLSSVSRFSAVIAFAVFFCFRFGGASAMYAHSTDETYIWLNPMDDHFGGEVQIRLPDLREHLKLEIPEEFEAAKLSLIGHSEVLEEYIRDHFELRTLDGKVVPYEITGIDALESKYFKHFVKVLYKTEIFEKLPEKLIVKSTLMFEYDKFSRSLLCMNYSSFTDLPQKIPGEKGITEDGLGEGFYHTIFTHWMPEQEVDLKNVTQVENAWTYYVWEGIRHIWIGTDHILFLVTLLLASVLVRRKEESAMEDVEMGDGHQPTDFQKWVPVQGFSGAFWNILKIVTVFTVAHSITLALASLDVISLESWLVESIIAFSIILVALNNIFPVFHDKTWVVLFLFGLFHGMGFASVMQNLPFRMGDLRTLLISFNVGVELGQLVIVLAIFPFIFFLRKSKFYQPAILFGGSILICIIAGKWFVERAFLGG